MMPTDHSMGNLLPKASFSHTESMAKMMSLSSRNTSATSSGVTAALERDDEALPVQVGRHWHQAAHQPDDRIAVGADLLLRRWV